MIEYRLSSDGTTAVDPNYFYRTMDSCPVNASVWLLTKYGKAIDGVYRGEPDIVGWCPKAKIPPEIKELMR